MAGQQQAVITAKELQLFGCLKNDLAAVRHEQPRAEFLAGIIQDVRGDDRFAGACWSH